MTALPPGLVEVTRILTQKERDDELEQNGSAQHPNYPDKDFSIDAAYEVLMAELQEEPLH